MSDLFGLLFSLLQKKNASCNTSVDRVEACMHCNRQRHQTPIHLLLLWHPAARVVEVLVGLKWS